MRKPPRAPSRLLLLLVALAWLQGSAAAQEPAAALAEAMAERLQLMEGVAQYKWNRAIPIEDLERERVVLDNVVAAAEAEGASLDLATDFFRAQITAAKAIQSRFFEAWRQQGAGPFPNPPDLKTEVRPAISALTARIIAALAGLDGIDAAALCAALAPTPAALAADADAWRIAAAPLRERKGGC
ncbi:gamma subclass chorismate mutase AroQ [Pelagibius marinus]|uniref:gamma subclass chorismate mutase AroQ n=1 Tax=Pelagibius marinus TaxID=2762760 RepID=UPI0018725A78|nr:gamma subclass chorismate mutase AroQ [Pelagibius marinus]